MFLVLFSFNDHIIPSFPFRGFTLKWYDELGFDFVMHEALYNSLYVATATTLVSTVLGTLAALPLVRCAFRLRAAVAEAGRSGRAGTTTSSYASP